jgi:hypothetical protein
MANLNNTSVGGVSGVQLPRGTTAQRPSSPADGYVRFNTDTNTVEYYRGAAWRRIDDYVEMNVTGAVYTGEIYDNDTPYTVHVFTGAGSFTPTYAGEIEYLIVAGGGGGGGIIGGGGGAGGLLNDRTQVNNTTYQVTVGLGGNGGLGWNNDPQYGSVGGDSSIAGIGVASGGGGGGPHSGQSAAVTSGGSGGGGAAPGYIGSGIAGQGYSGGGGDGDTGGGGGGAGEPGDTATSATATNNGDGRGGNGKSLTVAGYQFFYAGGGGSGSRAGSSRVAGRGGLGGGGTGSTVTERATDGAPFTGGGGGGAGYNASSTADLGGDGGSGVVIVRYKRKDTSSVTPSPIHTENLAVHFDAGDLRSYNYGASDVNDRSGFYIYNIGGPYNSTNIQFTFEGVPKEGNWSGLAGGCWEINGTQWMQGDLSSLDDGTGKLTIEMWAKRNDTSGTEYYWDARNGGGTWMLSEYDGYDYNWGNVVRFNESNNYNQWHQVVAVKDGQESRLYRNGVLKATGGDVNGILGTDFHIATRYTNSSYWNGQIAIFRIYREALGDASVLQNFNAQRGRFGI